MKIKILIAVCCLMAVGARAEEPQGLPPWLESNLFLERDAYDLAVGKAKHHLVNDNYWGKFVSYDIAEFDEYFVRTISVDGERFADSALTRQKFQVYVCGQGTDSFHEPDSFHFFYTISVESCIAKGKPRDDRYTFLNIYHSEHGILKNWWITSADTKP